MQQGHDVPAELLGGAGGEGCIQISGDREEAAHDIVWLEIVGGDQRAKQLVGRR